MKFFPHYATASAKTAIYVDGNILIKADLTPLIQAFTESGADIALFPHPSQRTVRQEFKHAIAVGRIAPKDVALAEAQMERYGSLRLLDTTITENSILFYNMQSERIRRLGEIWWDELNAYSKRDQVSLPYALRESGAAAHYWDWHFEDNLNPFFARYSHKYGTRWAQSVRKVHFLKDFNTGYSAIWKGIKTLGWAKRLIVSKN